MNEHRSLAARIELPIGCTSLEIVIRTDSGQIIDRDAGGGIVLIIQPAGDTGAATNLGSQSGRNALGPSEPAHAPLRLLPSDRSAPTCAAGSAPAKRNTARLSRRELEVLGLIANGHANREIAEDLVITLPTVERHVSNIYSKIGARGRVDAVKYAVERGHDEVGTGEPRGAAPKRVTRSRVLGV